MKVNLQTSIGGATGTSPMCKHACGMIRDMGENGVRKRKTVYGIRIALLVILALLCVLTFKPDTGHVFAKEKESKSKNAAQEKQGRFVKGTDGIWHRQDENSFSEVFKRIKREITYSTFSLSLNDTSMEISFAGREILKVLGKAADTIGQELGSDAVCMFVGDIMCLKGQQYAAEIKGGYDFWPSYSYVAEQFKTADLVCGNLETLLSESNPYTKAQVNAANGQPQCNGPTVLLDALRRAGFDMLVTANNHTCDWGAQGITETKQHLDEYGFANAGTHYYSKKEAKAGERFSIFDVNGIKVAVLSYTHIINQRGKLNSSETAIMFHQFDREVVQKDIDDARAKGAEFIAVYCHWGIENTETLNSAQQEDSKFLAEAGADLIIGSHPHCLQSCKYIKTDSGKKVLCMFSMGNFCSSMARDINNDTIILRIELQKVMSNKKITVQMTDASYIPCRVCNKDNHNCVVVPTNKKFNGGYTSETLNSAAKRISKIMNGVIPEYTGKK